MRALLLVLACAAAAAHAQTKSEQRVNDYPVRPLRIIVTVPAGGGVDSATRAMAQKMSERTGVNVIVDNRVGGTGTIAMNITRQSAPDGYTVLSSSNSMVVTGVLGKVPYDIRTAFDPVVQMTSSAYVVTTNPALNVTSIKELIALAKAKPGALSYGTPGMGSIVHLGTEQFALAAGGLRLVHVPYKGNGFAIIDLLAGRIEVIFAAAGVATHIKSGRLRALAVTSRRRMQAFPDLPTASESGISGFVMENAYGLYAPAGVRPEIRLALNKEVSIAINSAEARDKIAADGAEPAAPHTPAQFKAQFLEQYEQLSKFIRTSGIKVE